MAPVTTAGQSQIFMLAAFLIETDSRILFFFISILSLSVCHSHFSIVDPKRTKAYSTSVEDLYQSLNIVLTDFEVCLNVKIDRHAL